MFKKNLYVIVVGTMYMSVANPRSILGICFEFNVDVNMFQLNTNLIY